MGLRMTLFGFFFASAFGQLFDCLVGSCCGQTACSAEYKGDDSVTRTDNLRGNEKGNKAAQCAENGGCQRYEAIEFFRTPDSSFHNVDNRVNDGCDGGDRCDFRK